MIIQSHKSKFGVKVAEYWRDQKWVDLSTIDPNLKHVNMKLNQAIINPRREDHLVWGRAPLEIYLVAFVVLMLAQSQDSILY